LDFGRTSERIDDAGELGQEAVASRFDDAAAMFCNFRVSHLGAEDLKPRKRPFLVGSFARVVSIRAELGSMWRHT
jgi:hypothetical protein